jgi:hypothetical protein
MVDMREWQKQNIGNVIRQWTLGEYGMVSSVPGLCKEQCGERFEVDKDIVVNIGEGQCVEVDKGSVLNTMDKGSVLEWTRAVR